MNSVPQETSPAQVGSRLPVVPWGWRQVLAGVVVAGVGILVLNLLVVGASVLLALALRDNKQVLLVFLVVQDAIIVLAAWIFSAARYRVGWDSLGLRSFPVGSGCGLAIGLLVLSYIIRLIYGLIAFALGVQLEPQQVLDRLEMQGPGFLLTLFAAAAVAPFAEELFFRGFVYGGLRRRIGVLGAMLVSTLFFTALHASLQLFIPIFALGLFLAWLYESTGSLYPGILLHAANNALSLVLFFVLQNSGLLPS